MIFCQGYASFRIWSKYYSFGFESRNSSHVSSTSLNDSNRRPSIKCCTIDWMWPNFDTVQFFKLVPGLSSGMQLCIVLLKQSAFSTNKTWILFNQRIVDSTQLLAVKFSVDGAIIRHKFKMQDSFEVSPNANHDLLSKWILFWNG